MIVKHPQSICRFGIARCDITPPVGIYHRMWGAASHEQASGVHRPLTATAAVFQAPGSAAPGPEAEQVLVAADLCLLWAREMNDLLRAVCGGTGLAREQIAVNFSHTHAAGLMGLERGGLPGGEKIGPYLENLAEKIIGLVKEARQSVQEATITYGTGRCDLAGNRDFWDETSRQFVCGFNPQGPADDAVLVARVTGADGRTLAGFVNYACHPTTLAWQNTLISPDFPGAMREVVEEHSKAPCVFIQGASGDIGPRQGFVGETAQADRNGRQLGFAALAVLEGLPPPRTRFTYAGPVVSGATIGTWEHRPMEESGLATLLRWRLKRWTIDLPYRPELRTLEQTQAELRSWQEKEQAARSGGDARQAGDCRAMAERMTRWLTRLGDLPPGKSFPFPVTLWQTGEALWLAVEGELYNHFQRSLRDRFPGMPLVLATLTNGSRTTYLPTAETYGKGIYQESIAVLAQGCLEELLERIGGQIEEWVNQNA